MQNYWEDFMLAVLGQGRITCIRTEVCFTGVCICQGMPWMHHICKFIADLPFLSVETSMGQSFCIVIKLYLEVYGYVCGVWWENLCNFLINLCMCVVPSVPSCCTFICILCVAFHVAFCPEATWFSQP